MSERRKRPRPKQASCAHRACQYLTAPGVEGRTVCEDGAVQIDGRTAQHRERWDADVSEPRITFTMGEEAMEMLARRAADLVREGMEDQGYSMKQAAEFLGCGRIESTRSFGQAHPALQGRARALFDRGELREYVRQGGAKRP